MIVFTSERMIIRSKASVVNGQFVRTPYKEKPVDIFNLPNRTYEDDGFAFYNGNEIIGHLYVCFDEKPYELNGGIDREDYRKQGYMTEGITRCIKWIFESCDTDVIWAERGNIIPEASRKLLERCGFIYYGKGVDDGEWYMLTREKWKK